MGVDPVPEPLPVTANDQDTLMPGLNASAPVTAFKHYGRVVGDDEKFKTGIALAKCNRGNIVVIADVMRATDTKVSRLATSLDNLTVERVRNLGTADKDLILRVASLEHRTPVAGDLTAATLSRGLPSNFHQFLHQNEFRGTDISI
ncbi:hypothetical protein K438DRAFT_1765874 [Mycena galopus ATCC 62051]|nr:hypothetical protein K438DRAFT_1765874 [Mycena galopus ATCC 62051]